MCRLLLQQDKSEKESKQIASHPLFLFRRRRKRHCHGLSTTASWHESSTAVLVGWSWQSRNGISRSTAVLWWVPKNRRSIFLIIVSLVGTAPAPPPPVPMYAQTTTFVTPMVSFIGRHPQGMQCPTCRQQIVTNVHHEVGGGAWLIAALICIFGGVLGCCFIPFCVSGCQDAIHTCPACRACIGRRNLL